MANGRILVMGASGFLGRRVVAHLADLHDDVIAHALYPFRTDGIRSGGTHGVRM